MDTLPPARCQDGHQGNQPDFAVRAALYGLVGTDLSQLHGLGPYTALMLTSWLTLAPGSKISGGKKLSSKTRRSSSRAAHLLRRARILGFTLVPAADA